jgi:hypothetical protein
MPSGCPERIAISQRVAEAVDARRLLQLHDYLHKNDPALALDSAVSVRVKAKAELEIAENALQDHVREHGCGLKTFAATTS